jgi:stress response protein SCP2
MPTVDLGPGRLLVKVSWGQLDAAAQGTADLDLQALLFKDNGVVADAVYWNRPRSQDGAVTHASGDQGGRQFNAEEMVIALEQLDPSVAAVAFTLSSFDTQVPIAAVHDVAVSIEHQPTPVKGSSTAEFHSTAFPVVGRGAVVALVFVVRRLGKGRFSADDEVRAMQGYTFAEAAPFIRQHLGYPLPPPGTPPFAIPLTLRKGEAIDVLSARDEAASASTTRSGMSMNDASVPTVSKITAGAGWDVVSGADADDVDLSAVLLDRENNIAHRVFWGQLSACDGAVKHSGDNATGEDSDGRSGGDDETIDVNLARIPREISTIVFLVTNYNQKSLRFVRNLHFRLFRPRVVGKTDEITLASVHNFDTVGGNASGIAAAMLIRGWDGGWRIVAICEPLVGESILDRGVSDRVVDLVCRGVVDHEEPRNLRQAVEAAASWKEQQIRRPPRPATAGAGPRAQLSVSPDKVDKAPRTRQQRITAGPKVSMTMWLLVLLSVLLAFYFPF